MSRVRTAGAALIALLLAGCGDAGEAEMVVTSDGVVKTAATVRATRRAFDGAPPVIPHDAIGGCILCHDADGLQVPDLGYAPPCPHDVLDGEGPLSRCNQCHVFQKSDQVFRASSFVGLAQDLRAGTRQSDVAPPVMPHPVFMRENCQACHTGPAAREEIRCTHPERARCTQCHVPQVTGSDFRRES